MATFFRRVGWLRWRGICGSSVHMAAHREAVKDYVRDLKVRVLKPVY